MKYIDIFQFEELNKKMESSTVTISTSRNEINDLKRRLQALQIELNSEHSLVIYNTLRHNVKNPNSNH